MSAHQPHPSAHFLSLAYTHTDAKAVKSWIKCFPGKAQRVLALLSRCCQKTRLLCPPLIVITVLATEEGLIHGEGGVTAAVRSVMSSHCAKQANEREL